MFTRSRRGLLSIFLAVLLLALDSSAREPIKSPPPTTQTKIVRARDLGIPFEGTPGKLNAITDVPGVEVGYTTLISGEGKLEVGKGPVHWAFAHFEFSFATDQRRVTDFDAGDICYGIKLSRSPFKRNTQIACANNFRLSCRRRRFDRLTR